MVRPRYSKQILSGVQSEEHYKSRLQTIEADLKERQESLESQAAEKSQPMQLFWKLRKRQEAEEDRFQYSAQIEECSRAVENGKNEIIEASQYPCHYQRKSPAFRYHDGAESTSVKQESVRDSFI